MSTGDRGEGRGGRRAISWTGWLGGPGTGMQWVKSCMHIHLSNLRVLYVLLMLYVLLLYVHAALKGKVTRRKRALHPVCREGQVEIKSGDTMPPV